MQNRANFFVAVIPEWLIFVNIVNGLIEVKKSVSLFITISDTFWQ